MNPVMTLEEVNNQFQSEWVLFGDPELDANLKVVRGSVLWHGKDENELDRKLLQLKPRSAATVYTGMLPDDVVVVL